MDSDLTTQMNYIDEELGRLSANATRIAEDPEGKDAEKEADLVVQRVLALVAVANNVVGNHLSAFESFGNNKGGDSLIEKALDKLREWIDTIQDVLRKLVDKSSATGFSLSAGGSLHGLIPTITIFWEPQRPQKSVLDEATYVRTIR